jgi:hypothetical protein
MTTYAPVGMTALQARVRQRADMEDTTFVSDSELQGYINGSWGELYDVLLEVMGPYHFHESISFNTIAGQAAYRLNGNIASTFPLSAPYTVEAPYDIYKIVGVDILVDGRYVPIRAASFPERNRSAGDAGWTGADVRYVIGGSMSASQPFKSISFIPTPQEVHTVNIIYIPTPPPLAATAATTESSWPGTTTILGHSGWEEYVVVDAAIKCLAKEESDVRLLMAERERLLQRIKYHAATMDTADAGSARDLDSEGILDPRGFYR